MVPRVHAEILTIGDELCRGEIVDIGVPQTIADGAQTSHLGQHNFAVIRRLVDDIVTVSDAQLVDAMKFFAERMKTVVEPTGCLAPSLATTPGFRSTTPCAKP